VGSHGWIGVGKPGVGHPPYGNIRAIASDPDREAPNTGPAIAAVHGREVDQRPCQAVEADIDVFLADPVGARVEEP
jgi:hypothetical protein